jgi:hypothetical protein
MARLIDAGCSDARWILEDADIQSAVQKIAKSTVQSLDISEDVDLSQIGLSFLKELPNLKKLGVGSKKPINLAALAECVHLEDLSIGDQISAGFDIGLLRNLEKLSLTISKRQGLPNRKMPKLKNLYVWKNQTESLDYLANFPNLTNLWVSESAKLTTLNGIDNCKKIERLDISYCNSLKDTNKLQSLVNLNHLQLHNLKSCADVVDDLPENLRKLFAQKIPSITNTAKLKSLKKLDFLTLVDVEIKAGDLDMLLEIPTLRHCVVRPNKPHYQPKASVVYDAIKARNPT